MRNLEGDHGEGFAIDLCHSIKIFERARIFLQAYYVIDDHWELYPIIGPRSHSSAMWVEGWVDAWTPTPLIDNPGFVEKG